MATTASSPCRNFSFPDGIRPEFIHRPTNDPAGPNREKNEIAFRSLLNSCDFRFGARRNARTALGVDEELFGSWSTTPRP